MSKHTQTPWEIDSTKYSTGIFSGKLWIMEDFNPNHLNDLQRIVACVNAMEGLTNEEVANLRKDADQEKEKIAVAFTEWKENETEYINEYYYLSPLSIRFKTNSDLYQYFITNVYNK